MKINKLTGDNKRLLPPGLTEAEIDVVRATAIKARPEHVTIYGRKYWADADGTVFVVAWEDDSGVSGDVI